MFMFSFELDFERTDKPSKLSYTPFLDLATIFSNFAIFLAATILNFFYVCAVISYGGLYPPMHDYVLYPGPKI